MAGYVEATGCEHRPKSQGSPPCPSLTSGILLLPAAGHNRFDPRRSSTYSTHGQTFSLQYGSGSLTGFFGYDTMTVSDAAAVPTQDVGSNLTGLGDPEQSGKHLVLHCTGQEVSTVRAHSFTH